jgi:flagellar hook protein FlgE
MGLFGALFAGVSGLDSQSNKIGIISNNISNVNTVGFKQGQAAFDTLVVPSGTTSFSPGGVIGNTQQLVDQQGLIQATSSPTDIAITGNGFFNVNTEADGTGTSLLTRAGSFTQDSNGNFVNSDNLFLQGIPVTTPPTSVNATNLKTVSVNQSATGSATATSLVTLAANFDASQTPLLGPGLTDGALTGNNNTGISGSQIIVGNDFDSQNSINSIVRGDKLTVLSNGTTTDTFTYGGFTVGRNVNDAINGVTTTGDGDGANTLDSETVTGANITNDGSTTVTVKIPTAEAGAYTSPGGYISLVGASGINAIPAADINGQHIITGLTSAAGTTTITFTASVAGGGVTTNASTSSATVSNRSYSFAGNILDATTASGDFLGTTGTAPFAADALKFSIDVANVGNFTFQYESTPDPTTGSFNSLNTLATAINDSGSLTARVENGRLYISADDANDAVTYKNGDATGNSSGGGIDWLQELDLPSGAMANVNAGAATGTFLFNTLNGLASQVNAADPSNLVASVNNPTGSATININEANAEQTIQFSDTGTGSLLNELGFAVGAATTTGTLAQTYNATSATTDMSSGKITPQFTKDFTIYDALGAAHTIALNVAKISTATATWAVELTAVPPTDAPGTNGDGQIVAGTVTFNGDGTLASVSPSLENPILINWNPITVGASPSQVSLNLGTVGESNGLSQSAAAFNVSTANQNGSPIGQLTGVTIDQNGFVIETFSNGQTQQVFQVPLANVSNPDGLEAVSGDAYQQTLASGQVSLNTAGNGGVGTITPSALEQSNVDLSTQLTNLIVAQQAYGANSKVLTIADTLLQELDQIIQS